MKPEINDFLTFDVFFGTSFKEKAVVSALENEGNRCWYAPRDITP